MEGIIKKSVNVGEMVKAEMEEKHVGQIEYGEWGPGMHEIR